MRNQLDIDAALSRAIIREIGERLRASLSEDELPATLKAQLHRLDQLDDQSSLSIVPEFFKVNVAHYKELLAAETDERKIAMIRKLLAEEEAKYAEWRAKNPTPKKPG